MDLELQYTNPYELSLTARVGFEEAEAKNTLAAVLPTQTVLGNSITLLKGDNGLVEVAEYRSYDAETSFGSVGEEVEEVEVKLPALGQQARISEADQLTMMGVGGAQAHESARLRAAKRLGQAVADRIELARGQVLQTGVFTANENRFKKTVDFERSAEMNVTAGNLWNAENADPLADIDAWVQAYSDLNGEDPEALLLSKAAMRAFKVSPAVRAALYGTDSGKRVSNEDIAGLLAGEGLPRLVEYNRKVRKGGASIDVLDPNVAVFVPSADANAGSTAFGTTLESMEPDYGFADIMERAGIVVGAYKSRNPIGIYVHSAAIGMPVLRDADRFMAATVLG